MKVLRNMTMFSIAFLLIVVLCPLKSTGDDGKGSGQRKKYQKYDVIVQPVDFATRARAYLWLPKGPPPSTAFVILHPSSNFTRHFTAEPLASAGFAVLAMASRGENNDRATLMEEVLLDVKAGIGFLKNEDGKEARPTMPYLPRGQIKKIVLIGHSGGGPTMSFYQAEAENNQVKHLPSGEPVDLSSLPPADGLITLSSHRGRALVFTQEMDASLTDENDIYSIDPSLDLYNPDNGFNNYQKGESSNYSHDFLVRYRKEQNARNDRLTQRALALIKEAKEERERIENYTGCTMKKPIDVPFFSHRTSGDPRFFDMSLDPSDRLIGSGMGDALTVNYSPTNFKRVNTARNWLSMCSRTMSNAATEPNIARITVPALIVWATADRLIYRQDTEDIFQSCQCQSLPSERQNKTLVHVPGLTHMFSPIAPEYAEMTSRTMEKIIDWTRSCVEKGCSVGVRRVKLLVGGGEEPLGPPEVTDPLSREVPVLPAKKRPCPSIYHE